MNTRVCANAVSRLRNRSSNRGSIMLVERGGFFVRAASSARRLLAAVRIRWAIPTPEPAYLQQLVQRSGIYGAQRNSDDGNNRAARCYSRARFPANRPLLVQKHKVHRAFQRAIPF